MILYMAGASSICSASHHFTLVHHLSISHNLYFLVRIPSVHLMNHLAKKNQEAALISEGVYTPRRGTGAKSLLNCE